VDILEEAFFRILKSVAAIDPVLASVSSFLLLSFYSARLGKDTALLLDVRVRVGE